MHSIKWGLPYITQYKGRLIFGQIINLINILLAMVNPYVAGLIVRNVIEGAQHDLLFRYLFIMIGITVYRSVARYLFLLLFETTSQKILFELRRDVYHKLHIQNFSWFDKNRVGDIMSRMTGDLDAIRHFIAFDLHAIPENVVLYIVAVIVMSTISLPLTLALLVTTPIIMFAAFKQSKEIRPAFRNVREQFSNLNSICSENIGGNRVVKAFTKEAHEIEKFTIGNQAFYDSNMEAAEVRVKYFPIMETCAAVLPLILIFVGGLITIWGYIELWQLVAFSGYLWMINNPSRMFTWCVNDIQNAATSLDKVHDMMKQDIPIITPAENAITKEIKGTVEFRGVNFKYDRFEPSTPLTLKNITFSAKAGQTIGIVGETGSGKTTLVALIARFYDVLDGEILVDGVNVKDYSLPNLRSHIAYAKQDVFLYSDTVEGNIVYGVPEADMALVYESATIADADEFISKMPEGYDTIIGERGVGLSGGQKQRISLARAIAVEPSILVLDDVTSAVDMETEQRIQESLAKKLSNRNENGNGDTRTTFIVAHRLSSVKNADLILVLDNGAIVERGTHEELLALNGYYTKIHAMNSVKSFN